METHLEGTIYGEAYRGYNILSLIKKAQCMKIHIVGTMYGDS